MACNLIPTQLTVEQKAQICGILSVGCDWHSAANFAGCKISDIRRAIEIDAEFAASVRRSEAGAELTCMRTVQEAAKDVKNWRAATWWLERHAPERYGPRSAGVVTSRQLKAYLAILADVLGDGEQGPIEPSQVSARLRTFSQSVDELLRNERMLDPVALDAFRPDQADVGEREFNAANFEDAEFETSN
jgi:hypothetical protein